MREAMVTLTFMVACRLLVRCFKVCWFQNIEVDFATFHKHD
jgi:hypothetical protein